MQNISELYSLVGVIKCNTLQNGSHLFSSRFVGTTGYSRNCMKICNRYRLQFRTFGFTNNCTLPYLSSIIPYRGSNSLSCHKPLVLATEIHYTLFVCNKYQYQYLAPAHQLYYNYVRNFQPLVSLVKFLLHFTFLSCQNTEWSSDVTFCVICSISQFKF
jgi:hypothetical protein